MADRWDASAARLLDLHARLLGGDHEALGELWGLMWRPLCRRLRRRFSAAHAGLVEEVTDDAILAYGACPQVFDSVRQVPLDDFVYGIARRTLRDRLRGDQRRSEREKQAAAVFNAALAAQQRSLIAHVAVGEVRSQLSLVCTPAELGALTAWLDEGDSRALAERLGLSHLPRAQQIRHGELFLGRLIKRLQRRFGAKARMRAPGPTAKLARKNK